MHGISIMAGQRNARSAGTPLALGLHILDDSMIVWGRLECELVTRLDNWHF